MSESTSRRSLGSKLGTGPSESSGSGPSGRSGTQSGSGSLRAWAPIAALGVVMVIALVLGRARTDNSLEARTRSIASGIKCLVCQGLSVEQSKAGPARTIHQEIERQVRQGRTDADIRGFLVGRYGKELLLIPESSGAGSVVWAAPVVATVVAFGALAMVFRRWRVAARVGASAEPLTDLEQAQIDRARRLLARPVDAASSTIDAGGDA